jgi:hypothetical protein
VSNLFQLGPDPHDVESRVLELINSRDTKPWPLTEDQRALLHVLRWHKGADRAITIAMLDAKLNIDVRGIKDAVRSLVVDFGLPIVGSRRQPYGYYIAITAEEIAEAIRPLRGEIIQIARRVRALRGNEFLRELLGQIPMELDQEEAS